MCCIIKIIFHESKDMKFSLKDGSTVEVINNSSENYGELHSEDVETIERLDEALGPILLFAEQTLEEMKNKIKPSELEISFGAEAGGEGGFFGLAKAHAKATISITMKWKP